jgi:hypothetical protein
MQNLPPCPKAAAIVRLCKNRTVSVAGARRLRAAKLAELEKLPLRVVKLTDAEAIEAQCVEPFSEYTTASGSGSG